MASTLAGLLAAAGLASPALASAGQTVANLNVTTAAALVAEILGDGVSTSNVTYVGDRSAAGTFAGFDSMGFGSGLILSSGRATDAVGPNSTATKTTRFALAGDADLTELAGAETKDASVLEFDFVPTTGQITFDYVFSSEEYLKYVGSEFNDAFGFFVNGTNCALTPAGDAVTVNTINPGKNSELYRDNPVGSNPQPFDVQANGLTVVMQCVATVSKNKTNHVKLAIADTKDSDLDSSVFIGAGTFEANNPPKAVDTAVKTPYGTAVGITLSATDADADPLTYSVLTQPTHGRLVGAAPDLTYTPDTGYSGSDSFTYTANDGSATSNTALVQITVGAKPNTAPSAKNLDLKTAFETPTPVTLSGTDPDADALRYTVLTQPGHGKLSGTAPKLTYTPATGYSGPDRLTYSVSDGTSSSPTATVTISVTARSCVPATPKLEFSVDADQSDHAGSVRSPKFTTSKAGELLVAFVAVNGPSTSPQTVSTVTGGNLTWTLAKRDNTRTGSSEIWQAYATGKLDSTRVVASYAATGYTATMTVAGFTGAGKALGTATHQSGTDTTPRVSLTPQASGSLVWAVGRVIGSRYNPQPVSGQKIVHDHTFSDPSTGYWTQRATATTTAGTVVQIRDEDSAKIWGYSAVEIRGACG